MWTNKFCIIKSYVRRTNMISKCICYFIHLELKNRYTCMSIYKVEGRCNQWKVEIGIYYLQTILHGHENGDVARGWSQNKRQNGLSIKKGLYSQLDLGNPSVFFSLKNNSIFTYIHQQIKWEQNTGIDTKYKNYLYEGRSQKSIGWENTKVKLFWLPFQEQKAKREHVPSLSCNFILHSFFSRFCLQMICNFVSIFFYMSH